MILVLSKSLQTYFNDIFGNNNLVHYINYNSKPPKINSLIKIKKLYPTWSIIIMINFGKVLTYKIVKVLA